MLAGRYVGYSAWREESAGAEIVQDVHVDDLRTGRRSRWDALLCRGNDRGRIYWRHDRDPRTSIFR